MQAVSRTTRPRGRRSARRLPSRCWASASASLGWASVLSPGASAKRVGLGTNSLSGVEC